jgi:hypothetical protein
MIYLCSLKYKELSKKNIFNICKLKNEYWQYGLSANLKWFKKNIKKNDIHNLLFLNQKLIGYTLLRKRIAFAKYKQITKKINYLYFDTLIIKKNFRKCNYGKILMDFNSNIIIRQKLHSFLICHYRTINYYKKFHWVSLNKKEFKLIDHKSSLTGMVFNCEAKLRKNKILYYIH